MDHLKDVLQKRMSEHHLGSEALAATVCYNINQLAEGRFTASRYKNGVLTLTVASSSAAADLQAELSVLRQRFSERVAPNPINRIYVRQGVVENSKQ